VHSHSPQIFNWDAGNTAWNDMAEQDDALTKRDGASRQGIEVSLSLDHADSKPIRQVAGFVRTNPRTGRLSQKPAGTS